MKINPVYKREVTVSARSFRLPLIILTFNGILAVVALLNMYSVIAQVKLTAEVQYSSFLELYIFVASIEFAMLMFIMPAITAGTISGERERQTLDIMLTTKVTGAQIVLGKLFASFSTMFLLIFASFPVLALVFVYGGVTITELILLLLCYVVVALFAGSFGICFSALLKKSTIATVVSYVVIAFLVAGTYAINIFAMSIARMNTDRYASMIETTAEQVNSGGCIYLLLLNPAITFYVIINAQAGNNQVVNNLGQWFGNHPSNFLMEHWVLFSLGIQLLIMVVLLLVAIRAVNPLKKKAHL